MSKIKIGNWTPDKIKALRKMYNLTQEQFAGIAGLPKQSIQRLESGKHKISTSSCLTLDVIQEHLAQSKMQEARRKK